MPHDVERLLKKTIRESGRRGAWEPVANARSPKALQGQCLALAHCPGVNSAQTASARRGRTAIADTTVRSARGSTHRVARGVELCAGPRPRAAFRIRGAPTGPDRAPTRSSHAEGELGDMPTTPASMAARSSAPSLQSSITDGLRTIASSNGAQGSERSRGCATRRWTTSSDADSG